MLTLLICVIAAALIFDYINGFGVGPFLTRNFAELTGRARRCARHEQTVQA